MSFGFLYDNFGNKSHKRLIAIGSAIVGYILSCFVVIYGLGHVISSPTVVISITTGVIAVPIIALISTVFEKRGKPNA